MDKAEYVQHLQDTLDKAVSLSMKSHEGMVATYIPELANVNADETSAAVILSDGTVALSGHYLNHRFTLQSVAKLVVLIGLIEEEGQDKVFSWIGAEPSGQPFSSIAQLDRFGPIPSNPMLNAGAIALCSHIPGSPQERIRWLDVWMKKLFGQELGVNGKVFSSERLTADRNRSLSYLLKSNGVLMGNVEEILETYCCLCSYEADIKTSAHLAMLLANGGVLPDGTRIISESTCCTVVSIMATCGLYDESGIRLVLTGMPSKSSVSGLILAVATGRGGVAVCSPRLNAKAGSVRGHIILEELSKSLHWHFAIPWGYLSLKNE